MTSVADQKIHVGKCPACESSHDVEVKPYDRPDLPYSHWFMCPDKTQPVLLTVVMDSAGEPLQLEGQLMERIVAAHRTGRYFVSIFSFDKDAPEDRKVNRFCQNHHLPHDEYGPCLEWLRGEVTKIVTPAAPRVIRPADQEQLKRLPINLFGNGG